MDMPARLLRAAIDQRNGVGRKAQLPDTDTGSNVMFYLPYYVTPQQRDFIMVQNVDAEAWQAISAALVHSDPHSNVVFNHCSQPQFPVEGVPHVIQTAIPMKHVIYAQRITYTRPPGQGFEPWGFEESK